MLLKTILLAFVATAVHAGPVDHMKEGLITWCNANNATDKVEQVKILMDEYRECYPKMIDVERLDIEFNEAYTQGTGDDVARKNCAKAAQTKACIAKMYHAGALCHPEHVIEDLFELDIWNHSIDYMCYEEDGKTRLAKFINDGGVGCLTGINMSECYRSAAPNGLNSNLENWWRCVIDKLKTCSNPAAIHVQGLFENFHYEHPSGGNNQIL